MIYYYVIGAQVDPGPARQGRGVLREAEAHLRGQWHHLRGARDYYY